MMAGKTALLISCFNWYETRLKPVREILLREGFEVTVLVADFEHIKKCVIQDRLKECTYVHVLPYRKNLSVQRIRSHLGFGKAVKKYLEELQPDLVYLQVPPNNSARYCTAFREKHPESRLILDIIDLWPESMPLGKLRNLPILSFWKNWRNRCIVRADHVITECGLYQEKLKEYIRPERTDTLYLYKQSGPEKAEMALEAARRYSAVPGVLRFAYLGSINSIIDIPGICGILSGVVKSGIKAELHVIGDGGSRAAFEEAAKATGASCFFYGPIYDEAEKLRILGPCDFAFNMMVSSVEVGLTIKSVDYFSMGLPILNTIRGDTWEMTEQYGLGLNVKDPAGFDPVSLLNARFDRERIIRFFEEHFTEESFRKRARLVFSGIWQN